MSARWGMVVAAWLLLLAQVVHGVVPAETESEGFVGFYAGLALLLASAVAVVGVMRGERWAHRLTMWTGFVVATGFVLYHAIPLRTPLTNPYPGEPVGVAAWLSVGAAVAAGLVAGVLGRRATDGASAAQTGPRSRVVA